MEKKKEDQEYLEALDYLNIDEKELDDRSLVSYKEQQNVINKVTSLKNIVVSYQMNLEGKTYDVEKGGYVQTGKSLAGEDFIKLSAGILNSFAVESNLLTTKDKDTFIMQFKDAHEKVNLSLGMRNRALPERNQRAILKMWKDSFWNICEIIIGSGKNMESIFGSIQQLKEEETRGGRLF